MKYKSFNTFIVMLALSFSGLANAGLINSNSVLLDDTKASQLENWLQVGDLDWDSIWYGTTGATSTDWHNAVDGVFNTVSIYNVTHSGQDYLIGGYNANTWSSNPGWVHDVDGVWENFIFNLTTNVKAQTLQPLGNRRIGQYATYNNPDYFATFGMGFDLTAGMVNLNNGYTNDRGTYLGDNYNKSNIITGTSGLKQFTINSLETFVFSSATATKYSSTSVNDPIVESSNVTVLPEPSSFAIFGIGIIGLSVRRFKQQPLNGDTF